MGFKSAIIWTRLLEVFDRDHPEARGMVNDELRRYIAQCPSDDASAQALKNYNATGLAPGVVVDGSTNTPLLSASEDACYCSITDRQKNRCPHGNNDRFD